MSQYLDWKVGDKVVCVSSCVSPLVTGMVIEGKVYVIREIGLTGVGNVGIRVRGMQLASKSGAWRVTAGGKEIIRCNGDMFLGACRFRKIQPRKTDISIFEQMLHPSNAREDA